jgi:hypothetical protein
MKFEIVEVDKDNYVHAVFNDGEAAARYLKNNSYYFRDKKARIVKRAENAIEKLNDKKFKLIPGFMNYHPFRIRKDAPDQIFAVVDDEVKAIPAEQALKQFPYNITPVVLDACFSIWHDIKIEFAKTTEEILWVYKNGPISCTVTGCKDRGLDSKNPHPLAVIGDSDIQVAFVKNKTGARVLFRALVSHKKMVHDSGYTNNNQTMGEDGPKALEHLGFRRATASGASWAGLEINRIPLVENPEKLLIPALDIIYNNNYTVSSDGESLLIGSLPKLIKYRCDTNRGYAYQI